MNIGTGEPLVTGRGEIETENDFVDDYIENPTVQNVVRPKTIDSVNQALAMEYRADFLSPSINTR